LTRHPCIRRFRISRFARPAFIPVPSRTERAERHHRNFGAAHNALAGLRLRRALRRPDSEKGAACAAPLLLTLY